MPDSRPYLYLAAIVVIYVAGYVVFPAGVFSSSDESVYVEQAIAYANRNATVVGPYLPGTSLLQAPLVTIGGWRAAPLLSLLAMAATGLLLARWLRDIGYDPRFALLFLAYPPTLVMGRIATSELPSAAIVTLGFWLLWTADRSRWRWVAAGWLAGLSIVFRETNILLFLPFLVEAAIRRRSGRIPLTTGTLAGLCAALVACWVTGAPLPGLRPTEGFALSAFGRNIGIYAFCTFVLVPGGLVAVVAYRGRYHRAMITAAAAYLLVYLFYDYSGEDSGPYVRIAAVGRYLIPLVPLMTIAWADSLSRLALSMRMPHVTLPAFFAAGVAAFSVHPTLQTWSGPDAEVAARIASIGRGGALIIDDRQRKFVPPIDDVTTRHWMIETPVGSLPDLLSRHPAAYVVAVERPGAGVPHRLSIDPRAYVTAAAHLCEVEAVVDERHGPAHRLRIWRVPACGGDDASAPHRSELPEVALLFAPPAADTRDTIAFPRGN